MFIVLNAFAVTCYSFVNLADLPPLDCNTGDFDFNTLSRLLLAPSPLLNLEFTDFELRLLFIDEPTCLFNYCIDYCTSFCVDGFNFVFMM